MVDEKKEEMINKGEQVKESKGEEEEIDKFIERLLEEEDFIPEEVKNLDDSKSRPEAQYAFMKLKKKLKEEKQRREELEKKLKEVNEQASSNVSNTSYNPSLIWSNFVKQAQINLGILSPQTEAERNLVLAEAIRLYNEATNMILRRKEIEGKASSVIDSVLSRYSVLTADDKNKIKDELNSYDVIERVKEEVIEDVVLKYLGKKLLQEKVEKKDEEVRKEDIAVGAVNVGMLDTLPEEAGKIKSGRKGIAISVKDKKEEVVLTDEDYRVMQRMGLTDPKLYLEVKKQIK